MRIPSFDRDYVYLVHVLRGGIEHAVFRRGPFSTWAVYVPIGSSRRLYVAKSLRRWL